MLVHTKYILDHPHVTKVILCLTLASHVALTPRVYRQDKQNEVLVTNSSLNEKQMGLEQIRGAVKRAEHKSEQEGERVKGVCRESGQVMLAINNLHSRYVMTTLL